MSELQIDFNTITSGSTDSSNVTVTIDTLSAVTSDVVSKRIFEELVRNSRPAIRRSGFYIYHFWDKSNRIWFKQLDDGRVLFSGSPARSKTVPSFLEMVQELLGGWALNAKVTRLDCTITLPIQFDEFFVGIDFGKRRSCERYKSNSYGNTFYAGKVGRRHEIVVYDKRKERRSRGKIKERIKHPCTRIEINSIPKKGMLVHELPLVRSHSPFRGVKWYSVKLFPPVNTNKPAYERFIEFRTLLKQEGFFRTRRILRIRTQRNFEKLYGRFYSLTEVTPTLDEIFRIGIAGMFRH